MQINIRYIAVISYTVKKKRAASPVSHPYESANTVSCVLIHANSYTVKRRRIETEFLYASLNFRVSIILRYVHVRGTRNRLHIQFFY